VTICLSRWGLEPYRRRESIVGLLSMVSVPIPRRAHELTLRLIVIQITYDSAYYGRRPKLVQQGFPQGTNQNRLYTNQTDEHRVCPSLLQQMIIGSHQIASLTTIKPDFSDSRTAEPRVNQEILCDSPYRSHSPKSPDRQDNGMAAFSYLGSYLDHLPPTQRRNYDVQNHSACDGRTNAPSGHSSASSFHWRNQRWGR